MIRGVLFDLDGLMADSEPLAEWAWNEVLGRYGHRLDDALLQEILGLRVIDSAHVLQQRLELPLSPQEAMAERDRVFLAAVPERLAPLPGLFRLLDELEARGIPRAVATSGHRGYAQLALRTLGVVKRFHALATGDEVARGKPAPDIFLLAADRLDIPPAGCLVLEDSPLGIAAAKAAGMRVVAVPNPRIPAAEFSQADHVFDSLVAVHEKLDELLI